ncbi:DEAD/DEAH box RNA helicase [Aspergillus sclerotiicarbonarius CBS 121057]|uniref:RNA helicase n=1 Tax=Aspergillus sclerotiicarbonarius (strain CBS 121057 / IBT 28362) TaxID=1448318 RepID=A0A319EFC1_ASPSB|nr:DEAD/DEAH box RNA helicase [Aspergillus sclerotiicarbonarius CBS 121057]
MASFDVSDMSNALKESTGNESNPPTEAASIAREKGWTTPEQYDYEKYTATVTPLGPSQNDGDENLPAWAAQAAKYEWQDDYGDVGPENPALEEQLYRGEYINRTGLKIGNLQNIEVIAESRERPSPVKSFDEAGLHPIIRENIRLCRYEVPTPIQAYTIPAILTGHDLIAISQTGSGKTAAFLIPVLSQLMGKAKKLAAPRPNVADGYDRKVHAVTAEPLVLIVAPTRELSTQIFDEARRLCYRSMLRPCVVYGGAPSREQREDLEKGCDILIATPGRLLDFMNQNKVLSLRRVKYTIIDEADELLLSDWETEFQRIMSGGDVNEDADHRYMMFSATFDKGCREMARRFLAADHVRVRIGRPGSTHLNVDQNIIYVDPALKNKCLYDLIIAMPPSRTLIFVNSKSQADLVDDYLYNNKLPSTSIHSDRNQIEREDALRAFRTARCPILVATGVSARGLDIKNVMHVINYDLPRAQHGGITEYVHRIGRTARIGNEGLATSFYNHDHDSELAADLVKLLLETNQKIPDFLESYIPEDRVVKFDDDTDSENEKNENAGGNMDDAWGGAPMESEDAPAADPKWEF